MAKNGVFKKITALAMAIALVVCFAVSASADVNVVTTTEYAGDDIKVIATVTGISKDTNVTYYATKQVSGNTVNVHIDQQKAGDDGAEFVFNVDSAAELNSAVVIGYTGASEAVTGNKITGYTVTYPGGSIVIPTEATRVEFAWAPDTGKAFKDVTVTGTVTNPVGALEGENVVVTFEDIESDIEIVVNQEKTDVTSEATAEAIDAAALVSEGKADKVLAEGTGREDEKGNVVNGEFEDNADVNAEAGARKITVMGKVTDAVEYGIIVSKDAIVAGDISADAFNATYAANAYAGATKATNTGLFAVQLIDTSDAAAEQTDENRVFIEAGATYHTAVYAKDSNGAYRIDLGKDVVVD